VKILVVSDSHGDFDKLYKIYEKEKADYVFFAGDHSKDGIELSLVGDNSRFFIVKGNTDFSDRETPTQINLELGGYKILLTHGHLYSVKRGYNQILEEAKKGGMDIVLFGHTHKKMYQEYNGVHLFNPGAVMDGDYGIIEIKKEGLLFKHRRI